MTIPAPSSPAASPESELLAQPPAAMRWRWLPAPGGWRYYLLLAGAGLFVLGPLGGVAAAYMNFSLGFFIGGQVLAGILGSTLTFGYGAQGRHGANYIQTTAASVAGMSGMAVVIQAMAWMGMPEPPAWQLVLYMLCIGMFGVGVGMLCTPVLVDRMQLTFPSGLAVANILRLLTDPRQLRRSVGWLGGGALAGFALGAGMGAVPGAALAGGMFAGLAALLSRLGAAGFSGSTFGAGMIVGPRIGIAALAGGLASAAAVPWFIAAGWLQPGDPFRKITFLIALGMIVGAALVDLSRLGWQAAGALRALSRTRRAAADGLRDAAGTPVRHGRLLLWVACWGAATVVVGAGLLQQPAGYLAIAVALVFVFAMVNGISVGMVDQNPISSAFVVTVLILAATGLRDPHVGLLAATVLLVSTSIASDMQQDRSTGWRLGTDRTVQFRFQVAGVVVGAVLCVVLARFFLHAYPVLTADQTAMTAAAQPPRWTSAMTYKIVGVLNNLAGDQRHQRMAIALGVAIGLAVALLRLALWRSQAFLRFARGSRAGRVTDFLLDAVIIPSPYAVSFGGFVNLGVAAWFAAGGVAGGVAHSVRRPGVARCAPARQAEGADGGNAADSRLSLPAGMDSASLAGGGLIAGDALAALALGLAGLATLLGH